ncbi:MAG: HlyD family efflux transporter periplasmic adaptor subunit [Caldilineae bacterium]|nr:MAG: HlyD family efflux transporter periplasmic adaptor subunit [Caldilineae bacterium]
MTVLLISLAVTGCSLLPTGGRSSQAAAEEATPTPIPTPVVPLKPTYTVRRGEIVKELTFSGRIAPVVEEELFFRANGRVRAIYFRRDDMVKKGDIIADLEIDDLEREVESARLNLERAQSRLESAQRELEFNRRAAQINLDIANLQLLNLMTREPESSTAVAIQRKQVELAQIALDRLSGGVDPLLENDVARAQLQLEKLEKAIEDNQLIAPFDGQLLSVSLTVGRAAEAYKPVAVIADVSELEVKADLIGDQMNELEEGMKVTVILPSRPGEPLTGTIRRLPYPYGSGGGATVDDLDKSTRITLDQSPQDAGYELGDLVRVEAELERKADVLWLPPQALRTFDGRRFAVVQDGDAQRRVDVKVGIQTADRVEIEEGLEEGQIVVGQ